MQLHIKYAELTCSFSGETPPKAGQTYVDENGTEWNIRTDVRRDVVLSDEPVWSVPMGTVSLCGPIPHPLNLKRKLFPKEIREARQYLQNRGCSRIEFWNGELVIDPSELEGEFPYKVNGIPVRVFIEDDKADS
jgi:hypothetical protein